MRVYIDTFCVCAMGVLKRKANEMAWGRDGAMTGTAPVGNDNDGANGNELKMKEFMQS